MYYMKPDGEFVFSPNVDGLGGIMAPHNPMLGAAYAMSSLLPSDVGTPTIDMNVRMPDERAVLSGIDNTNVYAYNTGQFAEPMIGYQLDLGGYCGPDQFNNPALNGFGAVQDAVSVLSFVDLMSRA